jgi:hypothetical protein
MEEPLLSAVQCSVHGVSDVRQIEIHTAEPLVPESSAFEFEVTIEKLKKTQIARYCKILYFRIRIRIRQVLLIPKHN